MANACYEPWKGQLLQGGANSSLALTVKQTYADITSAYAFSAAHDFVNLLAANDNPNYGAAVALTTKTYSAAAVFDADDVLTPALTGAADMGAIILYVDSGVEATSRLALYLDTGITGMPFTPSGADTTVQWNASGIFKL